MAQDNTTSPATNLHLSLHTANPGTNDSQTTSEIAYTGYARKAVARSTGFGAAASGVSALAADNDFGTMTGGAGGTVTHAGLGRDVSGAGKMLYTGAVSPTIAVANNTIPRLAGTITTVTET